MEQWQLDELGIEYDYEYLTWVGVACDNAGPPPPGNLPAVGSSACKNKTERQLFTKLTLTHVEEQQKEHYNIAHTPEWRVVKGEGHRRRRLPLLLVRCLSSFVSQH